MHAKRATDQSLRLSVCKMFATKLTFMAQLRALGRNSFAFSSVTNATVRFVRMNVAVRLVMKFVMQHVT